MKACNFASLDTFHTERGVSGLGNVSRGDRELWDAFLTDSERLAAEATALVESMSMELPTEVPAFSGETEARREVVVRRAQGFFRKAVLAGYNGTCALSGIAVPELLTASHIVPWRDAVGSRADPRNGIALNALYDRAFDSGLFTLDEKLRVWLSPKLPPDTPLMNINGQSLRLPSRWRPLNTYLDYHRRKIFKE
jgi:putative restriction endonuclease